MKRNKIIICLIALFIFNVKVYAASTSLSVSSNNVSVGDTFTVYANMNSAAAWNIHVNASGPVSGCTINQADGTEDTMNTSKSFSASCTATGEGTITLTLSGDVTSADDGIAVNISGTTTVNVTKKAEQPVNNTPTNNNTNNTNNNNDNNNNKSNNNRIKEIQVEGLELQKIDDNNYELTVSQDVESIIINATVEDEKARLEGTGEKKLEIGENNFEIIVTAENWAQNKINVKVIRKDSYDIDDLNKLLSKDEIKDINITINNDTILSRDYINLIKQSKKIVTFNNYDGDKKLIYSYIIDGSKINTDEDVSLNISNTSDNLKNILKLSNYADGIYMKTNTSLSGTSLKIFVGNKYENGEIVNIYDYKDKKLYLLQDKVKVEDGYITFDLVDQDEYLITMSTIQKVEKEIPKVEKKQSPFFMIVAIIEVLIIFLIVSHFIIKKLKAKKNNEMLEMEESLKSHFIVDENIPTEESDNKVEFNENLDENINNNDDIQNESNKNYEDNNSNDEFNESNEIDKESNEVDINNNSDSNEDEKLV